MQGLIEELLKSEKGREQLEQVLNQLLVILTTEGKVKEQTDVKPVKAKDLMSLIIDRRYDEAEKMAQQLEAFLVFGNAEDKRRFAQDLYYLMLDWANEIIIVRRLKALLSKLLEEVFRIYNEEIEELQDEADRLSEAIERLYNKFGC